MVPDAMEAPDALAAKKDRNEKASPKKTEDPIAMVAINNGFSELVGALEYVDAELNAGLVNLFLNGTAQYTVFAPDNAAFGNLYALLDGLLPFDVDGITDVPAPVVLDVLLYHVAPGRRAANSVVPENADRRINTLLGEAFYVRSNGSIQDGLTGLRADASITLPNVSASNGIVHAISQVIVPPSVVAALTS
jgi:uncharacterized surface protein with fasciclin (FAS1) repeats